MRRLLILLSLFLCLLLTACVAKDKATDGSLSASSDSSETAASSDELLYDVWQIKYYSDDNETYKDYSKDISADGTMAFYTDATATISWNETDTNTYSFALNDEKNVITFNELDGERTMDFYFGFKVIKDAAGKRLVISRYNATEKEIDYFVLLPTE